MDNKSENQSTEQSNQQSTEHTKPTTPISLHNSVDFAKNSPMFKENTNLNGRANGTGSHALYRSYSTPVLNSKSKRKYETDFLLSFRHRPECKELPTGITQMPSDIIVDAVGQSRTPQTSRNNTPKTQPHNQQNYQTKVRRFAFVISLFADLKLFRIFLTTSKGSGRGKDAGGKGHKRASSSGGKSHKREPSLSKSQELPPVSISNFYCAHFSSFSIGLLILIKVAPLVSTDNRWIRPKGESEIETIFRKAQG